MIILFWILWIIDAVTALLALGLFFYELSRGEVHLASGFIWFFVLVTFAIILRGGISLKRDGELAVASVYLAVLALPIIMIALVFAYISNRFQYGAAF